LCGMWGSNRPRQPVFHRFGSVILHKAARFDRGARIPSP
jgi:hypothetical protein